ncbi:MAG: hypothetical protein IPM71_08375 [Bacteroidota bacterium]|nr:MAG: hypothetical protein IPM71_08375 [Bacteroidota bacterium]
MKKLQKTSSELQKLSHDQMNKVRGGEAEGKPTRVVKFKAGSELGEVVN